MNGAGERVRAGAETPAESAGARASARPAPPERVFRLEAGGPYGDRAAAERRALARAEMLDSEGFIVISARPMPDGQGPMGLARWRSVVEYILPAHALGPATPGVSYLKEERTADAGSACERARVLGAMLKAAGYVVSERTYWADPRGGACRVVFRR